MDVANTPRTTRDALTIELLGDVGRLHDQIKALPEGLKESLAPALGAIALASKEAQATIGQLGAAEKAAFKNFAAAEKVALRDSLVSAMNTTAGESMAGAARDLSRSVRLHEDAAKAARRHWGQWLAVTLAVALLGGAVGGALGVYGSHLLYDKQMANEAAFGRAVGTVWDSLDAKTKERIQAARNSQ